MTPRYADRCGHSCCEDPDGPPHSHRPYEDSRECPACMAVAKEAPPSPEAQALAERTRRFAERYGRPDRNTRRDP